MDSRLATLRIGLPALQRCDDGSDIEPRAIQRADDIVDARAAEVQVQARLLPPHFVPQLLQLATMALDQLADGWFGIRYGVKRDDHMIKRLVALDGPHS